MKYDRVKIDEKTSVYYEHTIEEYSVFIIEVKC